MTNKGIRKQYARAKNKNKEIERLAYINACTENEINEIINKENEMSPISTKLSPEQEKAVCEMYRDGMTAKEISEYIPKYKEIRYFIKRETAAGRLPYRNVMQKEKEPATAATVTSPEISSTDEIINSIIIPAPEEKVKEIPEIVREALLEKLKSRKREREIIADDLAMIDMQIAELEGFIRQVGGTV